MVPPDVAVAAEPAAAARQLMLFEVAEALTGSEVDFRRSPLAAAAATADQLCGGGRARTHAQQACTPAVAGLSDPNHEGCAAAAAAPAAASQECAAAASAASPRGRGAGSLETGVASPGSAETGAPAQSSAGNSAAASAASADWPATPADPAPQESESEAGVDAAPPALARSSETLRVPAAPAAAAAGTSDDAAGAPAAEAAPATEAAAGEQASAAAGDGTNSCELKYVYVGDDCFFLELPDGTLACVAGLENLPAASPSTVAGADDTEGHAEGAGEERIILARLQCHNCLQLLEFDSRAYFVQCSSCLTLNAVPNQASSLRGGRAMIVICGRCSTRNISCLGSVYVECWQCHTVCQVDYPTPAAAGLVNGEGNSAAASAAAAAAAAAGDAVRSAAPLDFSDRGGATGLFGNSGSRRRLYRLQRRLHWRPDEEESNVSAATGGERGTRLSTPVELPPALSSRGHGRSLLARHSFNPLPPRNLRIHLRGASRGAGNSSSSSSCRDGTSSDAGTAAAPNSSSTTQLQQTGLQRLEQRQRSRWHARPGTAPARVETLGGPPSEGCATSSRLLSRLFRLPLHGKHGGTERRATTAGILSGGPKNSQDRGVPVSNDEAAQVTRTRRRRRLGRRAPVQAFSDRNVSHGCGEVQSDDADERVAADRIGEASERPGERRACRRSARVMRTTDATLQAAEILGEYDATLCERTTLRCERQTSREAEEGGVTASRRAPRVRSITESGNIGATPAGASASCILLDLNPNTARRGAAGSDVAETPTETQETHRDTTYPLSPSTSFPLSTGGRGASEEGASRVGLARAPPTHPSTGNLCSVSETSGSAAASRVGEAPASATAPARRNWTLSFAGSMPHAPDVAHTDAARLTAAAAHTSTPPQSHAELQTNTLSEGDAAPYGTDVLRKSWRDALRHWRPQVRRNSARGGRLTDSYGRRGAGAVR